MYAFIDCSWERYTVEIIALALRISPRFYYDYKTGFWDGAKVLKEEYRSFMLKPTVVMAHCESRWTSGRMVIQSLPIR